MLTLFYDGSCPLCAREIASLRAHDSRAAITFVDINDLHQFDLYPQISYDDAVSTLHAIDSDGTVLLGLDANVAVWSAVGKMRWLKVLRWPIIRIGADAAYRLFARHRNRIGALFQTKQCDDACKVRCKHE